jgi:hypothetical protein
MSDSAPATPAAADGDAPGECRGWTMPAGGA